ncbi:hypothetical protein [Mycolicibacterium sp.]
MIRALMAIRRLREPVCVELYLPARQRVTIVVGERAARREAS